LEWHEQTHGAPEEYLSHLEKIGGSDWRDAVWYVSLIIALRMARVELVGMQATITRHTINRTTQIATHEEFWTTVFKRIETVSVVTTNYDILAERGLRIDPRPRVPRPGFNYGKRGENLPGGGYPSYTHIQAVRADGSVPLLKLHGSVSWAIRSDTLVRYHDCRPAIRGDALIVAPVTNKQISPYLKETWERAGNALRSAVAVIVVGYSLPEYDQMVTQLLGEAKMAEFHIFDPDPRVVSRYRDSLGRPAHAYPGLPDGLSELGKLLDGLKS
jgi:hypothetical protein